MNNEYDNLVDVCNRYTICLSFMLPTIVICVRLRNENRRFYCKYT